MYKISKEFSFAMGHRLFYHTGLCKNFHGHNYTVIVGIKSESLNSEGMVMDFSELKNVVNEFLNLFDHALMINSKDGAVVDKMREILPELKVISVPYEPTAENMSSAIYKFIADKLKTPVQMDYVTVYETDTSKATYTE